MYKKSYVRNFKPFMTLLKKKTSFIQKLVLPMVPRGIPSST